MKSVLFILLTSIALHSQAQKISFVDSTNGEPIEGLQVLYASLGKVNAGQRITNELGEVDGEGLSFPIAIKTSHLGFESFSDTLFSSSNYRFSLHPKKINLEDVIVTGQFNPQSAENSVFNVQVIDQQEIVARGATTLSEALVNSLNIRISQDLATGSSGIGLQGISGQNVKILLDGVALVNRNGNGNGADLSQINLNNIERIEIVEGPMAVNYGANALAGVINLISKKGTANATEIDLGLREESVGQEYGLGKGRHIQSVDVRQKVSEKWFAQVGLLRNDFDGFTGSALGRSKEWNPKLQYQGHSLVKYMPKSHEIYYRFDLLNELIKDPGLAQNNFLPSGENQPFAIDESYETKRYIHHFQAEGKLPFLNRYHVFASFSDFERVKSRFAKNLVTGQESKTTGAGDQDVSTYRVWENGGSGFDSFSSNVDFQVGYQVTLEEVGGGRIQSGKQSMNDVALYSSVEWQANKDVTLRPGVRFATNSVFGTQLIPSFQAKIDISEQSKLRLAYGRGYRAPSVRELYFEFIDSNHRIFGNPNLSPEFAHHLSTDVSKQYQFLGQTASVEAKAFYNTIDSMIGLAQSDLDVTATTYINVNEFKTLGFNLKQNVQWNDLKVGLGVSYIGRYNQLDAAQIDDLNTFFYTPEFNSSVQYRWKAISTGINLFYKYTGSLKNYIFTENEDGNQEVGIGEMSDFHWIDLTISKSLSSDFDLQLGARNLLNVRNINNSGASGGGHSGGASVPVSYGRSYFIKLNYNLKLK